MRKGSLCGGPSALAARILPGERRARKLAAAAAGAGGSIRLVEYPDAGHAFAIKRFPKSWRGNDATDAFRKTLDYLKRNFA
jgi:dipeptidyl aminopeptidase/acylaminoacyl peptidase